MNILITSAGRRVSLVRAFQKELKAVYPDAQVIAADAKPELAAACHVADRYFRVPRLDDPRFLEVFRSECLAHDIKMVIPTIDTELLLLSREIESFAALGIHLVVASEDFVSKCRNKRVIHEFFTAHGIQIAKEYPKNDYRLPLFIKPMDGSRSVDTYLIRKEEELTEYHFMNEKLMFLEYLDHKEHEEFTCDLYYGRDHNLKCAIPRKRIEVRDGEVNKGLTCRNELVPYIRERLAHVDGAVGCLTAQFFKHKETHAIYGIEINPRFGGGYPLSYRAGGNFPKWLIEEFFLGRSIGDRFEEWEDRLLMMRYDDEVLLHGYQG